MADYAVVRDGEIERIVNLDDTSGWYVGGYDPDFPANPYLLPLEITDPTYDPIAEIKEGPVDTVFADRVTHVFTVRAKNAGEIAAMKADKIAQIHTLGDSKLELAVTLREQVHALTDLVQLLYANTDTSGWGSPDQYLITEAMEKIDSIQNIRNYEEVKVEEVAALSDDPIVIDAYDVEAGW
jgi:hypothetical protein